MSVEPSNARLAYKLRVLTNSAIILLVFVPAAWTVDLLPFAWIWILALVAIATYVFFFILEPRPIQIRCSHCSAVLSSKTPWLCGFCKHLNRNVDEFPFVSRCQHCSAEPKAYVCHHCGKTVFLTADRQVEGCACSVNTPAPDPTSSDIATRKREVDDLEHRINIAKLTSELNHIVAKARFTEQKDPKAALEASVRDHLARTTAAEEIYVREKARLQLEYAANPDLLSRALTALSSWREDQM